MTSPRDPGASAPIAQTLLARLDRVIPAGAGRWYSRCPAHEDKSPSLSIRDTGERVLIHCFTGCDPEDVLAAVGLSWRDIYPNPVECAWKSPIHAARKSFQRTLAALDPLEIERTILAIAAADLRAGRSFSIEDRARVEVAKLRVQARQEVA